MFENIKINNSKLYSLFYSALVCKVHKESFLLKLLKIRNAKSNMADKLAIYTMNKVYCTLAVHDLSHCCSIFTKFTKLRGNIM